MNVGEAWTPSKPSEEVGDGVQVQLDIPAKMRPCRWCGLALVHHVERVRVVDEDGASVAAQLVKVGGKSFICAKEFQVVELRT